MFRNGSEGLAILFGVAGLVEDREVGGVAALGDAAVGHGFDHGAAGLMGVGAVAVAAVF